MHNALTRTKFTYSTKLTYSENPDKWLSLTLILSKKSVLQIKLPLDKKKKER